MVRILRSTEWYPATAEDARRGDYCAVQVYEGSGAGFVDSGLEPEHEFFYALFAGDAHGGWRDPVTVHVWTIAEDHAAEVSGDHRKAPAGENRRLGADSVLPVALVAAVLLGMTTSGITYRVAVASALVLAMSWHLVDGPEADAWPVMRLLMVPTLMGALVLAAAAMITAFASVIGQSSVFPFSFANVLWLEAIPLAMLGWWLFAGTAFTESVAGSRLRLALLVAGPTIVALAVPDLVVFAGALATVLVLLMDRSAVRRGGPGRKASRHAPPPASPTVDERDPHSPPPGGESAPGTLYRCPLHGLSYKIPHTRRFPRQYAAATMGGECLCPGRASWFVRAGLTRRDALLWLLVGLWVLNVADLVLTWRSVVIGGAIELNVLMRRALDLGMGPAFAIKVGTVSAGIVLIWRLRRHPHTLRATTFVAAAYSAVVVYQALGLLTR